VLYLARFGRSAVWVLLAALVLVAGGCGCCDDDHDDFEGGDLQMVNDPQSNVVLETIGVSVPGGPVELFDLFLFPGEDAFISLFPDDYDVDVYWGDMTVETVFGVPIFDDEVTPLLMYRFI
jgi:hypothetical protein